MSRLNLYFSSIPVGSMVKHALGTVTTVVVRLQPMTKTCNLFACLRESTLAFWERGPGSQFLLVKVVRRNVNRKRYAYKQCEPSDVILTGGDASD
jgi:hypothetical protein